MANLQYSVDARRAAWLLGGLVACVILLSLLVGVMGAVTGADYIFGLLPLLNIDREGNLPAWYNSALLGVASLVAFGLSSANAIDRIDARRGWRMVAYVLLVMSLDEGAQLHEYLGNLMSDALPDVGIFYFAWVVLGLAFALVALPLLFRFARHVDPRTRVGIIVSATIYFAGALGIEMITGTYMAAEENKLSMTYFLLSHAEELCEMSGVVILVWTLLRHAELSERTVVNPVEYAPARHGQV